MNRVANAPCSWGVIENIEGERYDYVRVLDEIAATGYGGTELGDWGFIAPPTPRSWRRSWPRASLRLLGSWVNNWLHDAARLPEDIDTCVRTAKLLAAVGGPECFIVLGNNPYGDPLRSLHSGRITPEMSMNDAQFEVLRPRRGRGCASGARRKRPAYRRAPAHRHLGGNAGRDRTSAGADRPGAAGHRLRYRPLALRWRRSRGGPAALRRARLVRAFQGPRPAGRAAVALAGLGRAALGRRGRLPGAGTGRRRLSGGAAGYWKRSATRAGSWSSRTCCLVWARRRRARAATVSTWPASGCRLRCAPGYVLH